MFSGLWFLYRDAAFEAFGDFSDFVEDLITLGKEMVFMESPRELAGRGCVVAIGETI